MAAGGHASKSPVPLALWLGAAGMLALVLVRTVDVYQTDFASFWQSAVSMRSGQELYATPSGAYAFPNLHPPTLTILFLPLSLIPLPSAFLLWTLVSIGSIAASFKVIARHVAQSRERWLWAIGACFVVQPCFLAWPGGQVIWVLLYPVTRAWASSSPWVAGCWLAVAIAIKPPLALIALALGWRITLTAALGSIFISLAAILVTGLGPWVEWFGLSEQVTWLAWPTNGSLWGVAARAMTGETNAASLSDLPTVVILPGVIVCLGLLMLAQHSSGPGRWVTAALWMTVVAPLGWIYYLPLIFGPGLATWRGTLAQRITLGLFCVPMPLVWNFLVWNYWSAVLLGSASFATVVLAWWAWRQSAALIDS